MMKPSIRRFLPILVALAGCSSGSGSSNGEHGGGDSDPTLPSGIDPEQATIPELQRAMGTGQLTSAQLTSFYLARIQRLNPRLHAVNATNPKAQTEAAESDERRKLGRTLGSLDGIPILVKDNIDMVSLPATAGSEALLEAHPGRDAFLVDRLRAAGAVVLGKANLSEWANFRSSVSSGGWSAVGGQTNNPYVLDRNPCGSSSGSAVAVSAQLAPVAIGTETDGSIICPSGTNGVVGIKPTLGLVSRAGVVPITAQQDTPGPIARSVTDAAIVLSVIQGVDPRDPATADSVGHTADDYTRFLDRNALSGKRIGVWISVTDGKSPETDTVFQGFIRTLRDIGATPVEVRLPYLEDLHQNEVQATLYEFKHDMNVYLAGTGGKHPLDLAGLIAYNEQHADTELRYFDQKALLLSQATSGDLTDPTYFAQRTAARDAARRSIEETVRTFELDAIAAPSNGPAWLTSFDKGDEGAFVSTRPAAVSGFASITVPMGFAGPLPVGVSFIGRRWDEPNLLALAFAYEQASHARRSPRLLSTL